MYPRHSKNYPRQKADSWICCERLQFTDLVICNLLWAICNLHLLWAIWICCEHLVLMWQLWATAIRIPLFHSSERAFVESKVESLQPFKFRRSFSLSHLWRLVSKYPKSSPKNNSPFLELNSAFLVFISVRVSMCSFLKMVCLFLFFFFFFLCYLNKTIRRKMETRSP